MSTKSFSNSTRNSFGVLGTLDDHLDNILSPKKEKKAEIPARNNNLASKKPQAPKIDVTQPKNSSNNDKSANGSKKKEDKKFSNSSNETSVSTLPTEKTSQSVQTSSSQSSVGKMLFFAMLMLVLPLAAYFWSVKQNGLNLGEIKSALVAVLVVNLLLFIYIVMALFEDSKESSKAKKD